MTVFDDLSAEQERLAGILGGLEDAQWLSASGAAGWTIADVVLHLAQSEESVVVTASGGELRGRMGPAAGGTVDERVASLVRAERAAPDVVFARWQQARRTALDALRAADPDRPLEWVAAPDGASVWEFGAAEAESGIAGPAGDFCRVAARRLAPASSRLRATGPHGAAALRLMRTYAE